MVIDFVKSLTDRITVFLSTDILGFIWFLKAVDKVSLLKVNIADIYL
jgi:hypothetical protein